MELETGADTIETQKIQQVVGLGEMALSTRDNEILITFSLGSCIGLTLYDPVARVGGLVHCMLPLSSRDREKAARRPCMFTDTGVAKLLQAVFDLGGERKRLVAKVAGAANLHESMTSFEIGSRNHTVLRKVLWKNSVLIASEEVGGSVARTLSLDMETGKSHVRSNMEVIEL